MWYVYVLLCDQKTFYVGISDKPEQRLIAHRNKESFFTKKFSDIKFAYCEEYPNKTKAVEREKQIKGWGRAKKQMLINGKLGYNTCTGLTEVLGKL
jgi:putative endonuclease